MSERIVGVDMPGNKHVWVSLTCIFGIGKSRAHEICKKCNVSPSVKFKELTESEVDKIKDAVSEYTVESDLKDKIYQSIKQLRDINCYRGIRHKKRLPVRGQRTRSNARTNKGRAKTVANKKK